MSEMDEMIVFFHLLRHLNNNDEKVAVCMLVVVHVKNTTNKVSQWEAGLFSDSAGQHTGTSFILLYCVSVPSSVNSSV